MTLPDQLTVARAASVPLVVLLYSWELPHNEVAATVLFCVAMATDWLDDVVARIVANDRLLAKLLAEHLPGVVYTRPRAGYLAWLDFRGIGLGDDPAVPLRENAYVALNSGLGFGSEGRGFVRLNLACSPETLREAVFRIASAYPSTPFPITASSATSETYDRCRNSSRAWMSEMCTSTTGASTTASASMIAIEVWV